MGNGPRKPWGTVNPVLNLALAMLLAIGLLSANTSAAAERQAFTVVVEEAYLDLRTGPGRAYPVFYVAQRGESLTVSKSRTDWYRVHLISNGGREIIGWVHREALGTTRVAYSELATRDHPYLKSDYEPHWRGNYALGNFGGADLISLTLSYDRLRALSFELDASVYSGVVEEGWFASAQLTYSPFYRWRVAPFISAGYGYLTRDARGNAILQDDSDDPYLLAAAGVFVRLSQQYHLRLDINQLNVLTTSRDNKERDYWRIGIGSYF